MTSGSTRLGSTVLGWPRIGPRRELKRATEAFWAGKTDADELGPGVPRGLGPVSTTCTR